MELEQKFFERHLDNDLGDLATYLQHEYSMMKNGSYGEFNTTGPFEESNSISTMNWYKYNALQFYRPEMHKLMKAIKEMTLEACEYYKLDFEKEQFYVQSWFNINYTKKGKLEWHDHHNEGAPRFHGYYCVNAEPSKTYYRVNGKEIENINKDNRAILSETGHPHAMADWDWEGPRITIAYDVIPLRFMIIDWTQHWIPLV
jgi:hypothetical protein